MAGSNFWSVGNFRSEHLLEPLSQACLDSPARALSRDEKNATGGYYNMPGRMALQVGDS